MQEIRIALLPDGKVVLKANVDSKVTLLGMLELAKALALNPQQQGEQSPILVPMNAMPAAGG
ncbi:MAG TPA: hypothetical protein VEA41_01090 [Salinarimonas sp.]|nr:hypothetical protein [Salinarimonas sp.]